MNNILLSPPAAFILLLIAGIILLFVLSLFSFRNKGEHGSQKKPYACGEDVTHHRLQPEYSQFFSFAFFFTIMHVVVLIVNTVPSGQYATSGIAILYLLGAFIGMLVLFRS